VTSALAPATRRTPPTRLRAHNAVLAALQASRPTARHRADLRPGNHPRRVIGPPARHYHRTRDDDLADQPDPPRDVPTDALIIGVVQGPDGPLPAPGAEDVDAALDGSLAATLTILGATGKAGEVTKIATAGRLTAPLIVAVGVGALNGTPPSEQEALRRAAGAGLRALGPGKARRVALALPARDDAEAEAVALGALLGSYAFGRYRADGQQPATDVTLLGGDWPAAVNRARILADAVTLVRDLVNTGPSHLVPAMFAAEAERVAAASGLDVEVLDEKALADGGYGGILGVGQGSVHPPRLVRLGYSHPDAAKTVVLAGKGITFDSGGLSLKPAKGMEAMKSDMGGAAAVLAAMQAIAALAPAVNVVGYMPLAENMPAAPRSGPPTSSPSSAAPRSRS